MFIIHVQLWSVEICPIRECLNTCSNMECWNMSHQGMFEYMFQYGVSKYVPTRNVWIYVPIRSVEMFQQGMFMNRCTNKVCFWLRLQICIKKASTMPTPASIIENTISGLNCFNFKAIKHTHHRNSNVEYLWPDQIFMM